MKWTKARRDAQSARSKAFHAAKRATQQTGESVVWLLLNERGECLRVFKQPILIGADLTRLGWTVDKREVHG